MYIYVTYCINVSANIKNEFDISNQLFLNTFL